MKYANADHIAWKQIFIQIDQHLKKLLQKYKGVPILWITMYISTVLNTLTFDLAFRWAKVQSKSGLKSKSKVISLSESRVQTSKFSLSNLLSESLIQSHTVFI